MCFIQVYRCWNFRNKLIKGNNLLIDILSGEATYCAKADPPVGGGDLNWDDPQIDKLPSNKILDQRDIYTNMF